MALRLLTLLATLAVAPGWGQTSTITIKVVGEPPEFRVDGSTILRRLNNPNFNGIFQVVVDGQQQPMLGRYEMDNGTLVFHPRFPLEPGVTYRATFSLLNEKAEFSYQLPKPKVASTTLVERIFPSASVLPENQLKFYIHFSAPMSKGEAAKRIHLMEEGTGEVKLPFLELDEELWDRDFRRLTVLFDPGRIKRGVTPNVEVGLPLKAGRKYKLIVEKDWPDAKGIPLVDAYVKEFTATEADRTPLDPKQWSVTPPQSGTQSTLAIDFPEPLDSALLLRFVDVIDPKGKPVRGKASLDNEEKRWVFSPDMPWQAGQYSLEILASLEDLAGNKVGRAFDVDRFEQVEQRVTSEMVSLPLTIN